MWLEPEKGGGGELGGWGGGLWGEMSFKRQIKATVQDFVGHIRDSG